MASALVGLHSLPQPDVKDSGDHVVPSVFSNDEYGVVVDSVDSNSNVIVSKKGVGKWNESIPVQNNDINKITKFISLAERAILG